MFARALQSTIDYCLFTLGFIVAVQLPEFIQQYQQYLAGKLSEANWHLAGYQKIADKEFAGDLTKLINEYLSSNSNAFAQTGELIAQHVERVQLLNAHVVALQNKEYLNKVWYFFTHLDLPDAEAVLHHYQLAIPLTMEAAITGLVFAFIVIWCRMAITAALSKAFDLTFPTKRRII